MECNFVPGQKVVCVNADHDAFNYDPTWIIDMGGLTVGEIYTIKDIFPDPRDNSDDIVVSLEEITRYYTFPDGRRIEYEQGFNHKRFRPLKETGMEKLKSLLNPKNHDMDLFDENHPLELEEELETSI